MNYLVIIAGLVCIAAVVCSAEEQSPFAESSLLQESFGQALNPESDASELLKSAEPSSDAGKIRQKRQFFGGYGGYGGYGGGFRRRGFGGYGRRFGGYGGYGGGFGYGGYGR